MDKKKAIERLDAIEKEAQELRKLINVPTDIKERIKTVEDAIEYLGEGDEEVLMLKYLRRPLTPTKHLVAYQELVVITKALNEGEALDWDNEKTKKWYNWFDMRGTLLFYSSRYCYYDSDVPSHLCFKTEALAEYAAKQFLPIYKTYMKS